MRHPLREAAAAHRQSETGHTRGKILLEIPVDLSDIPLFNWTTPAGGR